MAKQRKKLGPIDYALRTALVFILIFVLLPMFLDPRSNPFYVGGNSSLRRASCQSNLKQLGLALVQYSQDYDNTLPTYATADGHGWREAVYSYVKSTSVYQCADDARGRDNQYSPDDLPKSYGANAAALTGGSFLTFSEPSQMLAVTDTRGYSGEEWNMTSPAFLPDSGRELYAHLPRHIFYNHPAGTVNCLFADGHVKSKKPADTLTPVNLWTRDNAPFTGQDLANAQAILTHAEKE